MKRLLSGIVFGMLFSAYSFADDIYLGNPSYGGTGCPSGTASAALAPDGKSLSILFDSYLIEAGGPTGVMLGRKGCNIAIPVHIPQGLSISIFKVDYRGFNSLPAGAFSRFGVEYFFAGIQGPYYTKTFYGALNSNYTLSNTIAAGAIVWSPCGEDVILRSNSNMLVKTNANYDYALSTVDSADLRAGLVYHLQWRRC